jgi:hypothetical protein
LLLANLIRHGVLTTSTLARNKDALNALQSAVQVVFIIVGAVFSYYRFFRGRTFVSRADVAIMVEVIKATDAANLHAVTIDFKNLGTVSVIEPRPTVEVYVYGPSGEDAETWDNWRSVGPGTKRPTYSVVDSGETVSFLNDHTVPTAAWAVAYVAFVTDVDGVTWSRSKVVANKPAA